MGLVSTKAKNLVSKTIATEYRMSKVIDQEKPTLAPKHPSSIESIEKLKEASKGVFVNDRANDSTVAEMARKILITSSSVQTSPTQHAPDRDLRPHDTRQQEDPEFGYREPKRVPPGKLSMKQLLVLLSDRSSNPEKWTIQSISEQYNITQKDAASIIEYFATMTVIIPENTKEKYIQIAVPMENKEEQKSIPS